MCFYSQNGEDFLICEIFGNRRQGRFVEVGCIDGRRFSNTLVLEQRGWDGLCIEAHPGYIELLKSNRPGSAIVHCAVADREQDQATFYANNRGSLSTLKPEMEPYFREHYAGYFSGFQPCSVPMRTLSGIFDDYGFDDIDVLSLDVEGSELEALRGLDFSRHRPRLLVVECMTQEEERAVTSLLQVARYSCVFRLSSNYFYTSDTQLLHAVSGREYQVDLIHTEHPLDSNGDQTHRVKVSPVIVHGAQVLDGQTGSERIGKPGRAGTPGVAPAASDGGTTQECLDGNAAGPAPQESIVAATADLDFPFLVSFPRTGSHWLRMALEQYFARPLLTRSFFDHGASDDYLLLHSHDMDMHLLRRNVLYLYRDPVDTVFSQLQYHGEDCDDTEQVGYWADLYGQHVHKWLDNEEYTKRKCVLSYEDLRRNPVAELSRAVAHLGGTVDRARLAAVMEGLDKRFVKEYTSHDPRVVDDGGDYERRRAAFRERSGQFVWSRFLCGRSELAKRFGRDPVACPPAYAPATHSRQPWEYKKIVGLLAGKNEAPKLEFCIRALAMYCDSIVYLDDNSDDDSVAIVESLARECRVERILQKHDSRFHETIRRAVTLAAGREVGGTHFVVIDVDEAFTADCMNEDFLRRTILSLAPGESLEVPWIQLWRSVTTYRDDDSVWSRENKAIAFADDGLCAYEEQFIHLQRVPANLTGKRHRIDGRERGLLHFQFVHWRNLLVKQAWYRCLERVNDPDKPAGDINSLYAPSKDESDLKLTRAPYAWFSGYPFIDVDRFDEPETWRERQVLSWFDEFGPGHFQDLDIWDVDWGAGIGRDLMLIPSAVRRRQADGLVAQAERSYEAGDAESAVANLSEALERDPDHVEALNHLGVLEWTAGQVTNAVALFDRALALKPDFKPALVNGCQALAAGGMLVDALARIEQFEHRHPGDKEIEELKSTLTTRARQDEPLAPDSDAVAGHDLAKLNAYAEQLAESGCLEEAKQCLLSALSIHGNDEELLSNLGVVQLALGDPRAAEHAFLEALTANPDYGVAQDNLARVRELLGQPGAMSDELTADGEQSTSVCSPTVTAAVSPECPDTGSRTSRSSHQPRYLFVVGCPRSGTTALWHLLTADRRIGMGIERFGRMALGEKCITKDLFQKERFFDARPGDTFYTDLEAFNQYYSEVRSYYDACEFVGDKIPLLYTKLDDLKRTFGGEAKIIFLVRNIFDVAASYDARAKDADDQYWSKEKDAAEAVRDWSQALDAARDYGDMDVHLVSYETLFQQGCGLEELYEFLGMDIPEAVIDRYRGILSGSQRIENDRKRDLSWHDVLHIATVAPFEVYRDVLKRCRPEPQSPYRIASQTPPEMSTPLTPDAVTRQTGDANMHAKARELNNAAEQLAAQGRYEEAKEALLQSLQLLPDDAEVLNNLGVVCWELGEHVAALNALSGALTADPSHKEAAANIESIRRVVSATKELPVFAAAENGREEARAPADWPRITVITPSFNQAATLEDTIRSVLDQSYPNLEYIVIDGGSTDGSAEIIERYGPHLSYWISEADRGQSHGINKGLARATGDVVAWLNSDDFYYPGALASVAQAYVGHPEAGLYVGNGALVDRAGNRIRRYSNGLAFDFEVLLKGSNFILQPSTFINRRALQELGGVDESLNYTMDLELWLRVGRRFDVVTIDRELSAYRWSDDIKTATGGLKRWVEQWQTIQRYADVQLTPGLLVEFFKVLQEEQVRRDLGGHDIRQFAEVAWRSFYESMQQQLGTVDCIPQHSTGIGFSPCESTDAIESDRIGADPGAVEVRAPAFVRTPGSEPRVDIVLQATGDGRHAWGVGRGWENAARKLGVHHRTFAPVAQWGGLDVDFDDGLFEYLARPEADIILLLGFDWHSQMLHNSAGWRERWLRAPIHKVVYAQESILRGCRLLGNVAPRQAALSAVDLADSVVYTDLTDRAFLETLGKPCLWQPFGVDESVFVNGRPFDARKGRAFFRGKIAAFSDKTYTERRELIEFLQRNNVLDLLEYRDCPVSAEDLAADFNEYQVAVNFPSVFSNHPTRVYEALASGCALVTNATGIDAVDGLFEDGRELLYYRDRQGLLQAIHSLSEDPERAHRLAKAGRERVLERFTLDRHLREIVDRVESRFDAQDAERMASPEGIASLEDRGAAQTGARIVIDGVIFFLQEGRAGGISRVWTNLLQQLGRSELAKDIVLLDRGGTAPPVPGIRTRIVDDYDYRYFEDDSLYLQQICEEEGAELFLSTYYSCPERCHSMLLLHDMVPELCGEDLQQPEWRAKDKAIRRADAFLSVSESTGKDFRALYPQLRDRPLFVTPNATEEAFQPRPADEVAAFRERYGITKPYFLLVGNRLKYKNAMLFFRAFSLLSGRRELEVVCTGSTLLEAVFQPYVEDTTVHMVTLDDDELAAAYTGALALVYPSQHEGFGLPLIEAMRSNCPVITCHNSALSEVAGDSAIFVGEADVQGMVEALESVRVESVRTELVERGRFNAERFDWESTGKRLARAIAETLSEVRTRALHPEDPLHTGARVIRGLTARFGRTSVVDAMARLKHMYTGWLNLDYQGIGAAESAIAAMDGGHLTLLLEAVQGSRRCDAFVYYWLGLALEERGEAPAEALQAYWSAIERHDWVGGYRWRVAERAADLAVVVGHPELAVDLLKEMVLPEFPGHPTARAKLAGAELTLAAPPAEMSRPDHKTLEPLDNATDPSRPVVSVIVSVYGAAQYLPGCLEDLESQTMADRLEIIVVDSGSPDNEGEIVQAYQAKYGNIRYLRTEQRETVYGAWNRAIELAQGRYITNANADDRHAPDAIEKLAAVLESEPDVGVAYADCAVTRTPNVSLMEGDVVGRFRWPDFDRTRLFQVCYIGPQPMWRRTLHEQYGLFDASLECAGDYDFWLRVSDKTEFRHLPEVLGLYLQSPGSIEHRDPGAAGRESEAVRERHWPADQGQRPPVEGNFLELYVADAYAGQFETWPLVSVVIPTRNRPDELSDALNSVLGQTYPNIEAVVVNDGGEDIRGVIDRLSTTRPVKHIVNEVARGTSAARNIGLRNANGKYIAFLDDDDVFRPPHIATLVAELETDSQLVAAYSDGLQVNVDFGTEPPQLTGQVVQYSEDFSAEELLVRNYIPNLCVVARRSAVEQAGPFDETLSALEDWEWLIRLSRVGRFSHLPMVTVEYVARTGGPSRNWLEIDDIADLYRRIYSGGDRWADAAVRERQNVHFSAMTGRELERRDPVLPDHPRLGDTGEETAGEVPDVIAMASGTVYSNEHRIGTPLSALERLGLARTRTLRSERPEDARTAQGRLPAGPGAVLLAHNVTDDQGIQAMAHFRDRNDGVIVYSQDALTLDVPAYSSLRRFVPRDIKKRVRRALRLCDRLVVPTDAMAEAYRDMIGDIRVVPNYLARGQWDGRRSQRRQGDRLRVGWAGLPDHTGDLEVIVDVVKETADEVQWVFFGLCFEEWLTCGVEVHDGVDFQKYPETLASLNLDLAVAPLTLNRFNECRSNLKVLEYGALGIPVVCTDIEPFRDGPVARVRNTKSAWLRAIRERMADPDALGQEGDELQAWVFGNWMLEDRLDQWAQALAPERDVVLAKVAGQAE